MQKKLNFAVLGTGNGGRAFCGQIAGRGYPVVMYKPLGETTEFLQLKEEKEMYLTGNTSIGGKLQCVTRNMKEAITDADVIFIVVPSFAHRLIFQRMIPFIHDGQHIIIVPGNYGGFLLKKMMSELEVHKDISISETPSLPYACRIMKYNTVMIYKTKLRLKIATSPTNLNKKVVDILNRVFNGDVKFFSGQNLLEVDLDNLNQTLHPLPVLLNYGTIEQYPDTFRHYIDGITPLISNLMKKMDEERLSIGRSFDLKLMSSIDQLKMYYGDNDAETYYEYVNSEESPYKEIIGHSVTSRYITEDIPCLHVPTMELAMLVGINVPLTKLCVGLSSALLGVDYAIEGNTLDKLGLFGKTKDEIKTLGT